MMKTRIEHIDYLKGILIMLVIVGHTVESQVPDFQQVCTESGGGMRFLWKSIYYFHMHLFFFISGWLSHSNGGINTISVRDKLKKVLIRVLSLCFPYLWLKPVLEYLELRPVFWYLMTLLFMTALLFTVRLFEYKKYVFYTSLIVSYIVGVNLYRIVPYDCYIGYEVNRVSLYLPFFYAGYLLHRFEKPLSFMKNPLFFNLLLITFFVLSYHGFVLKMMVPFMLVLSLFLVFQNTKIIDNRLTRFIRYMGRNCLYIYILHPFFVFSIYSIGDIYVAYAQSNNIVQHTTGILIQFVTSFLLSLITLAVSLTIMVFIKRLALFDMLLFGNLKRYTELLPSIHLKKSVNEETMRDDNMTTEGH